MRKKVKGKFLAVLVAVMLILSCIPAGVAFASGATIATASYIAIGASNPTVYVILGNDTFAAAATTTGNWTFGLGTTGLTVGSITSVSSTEVSVNFTGTAAAGTVTITAEAAALTGDVASNTVSLVAGTLITGVAAITGTTQVGNTLTAGAVAPSDATATYYWVYATSQANAVADNYYYISGTPTGATYRPVAADLGHFIAVYALGSGSYCGNEYSAPVGPVTAAPIGAITITPAALNAAIVGQSYTQKTAFKASKGTYTYSYNSATGTGLPGGLTFNSSTAGVSGIPTQAGSFTFEVDATNTAGAVYSSAGHTLKVTAPTIKITGSLPSSVSQSVYFPTHWTASGGTLDQAQFTATESTWTTSGNVYANPDFTFTEVGRLPAGVFLATLGNTSSGTTTTGEVYGDPTQAGSFPFTLVAKDFNGFIATKSYTLTVKGPNITLKATLPAATAGISYAPSKGTYGFIATDSNNKATSSNAGATFKYQVTGLPAGLSSTGGAVTGAPTEAGIFPIQVVATENSTSALVYGTFSLTVNLPAITLKSSGSLTDSAGSSMTFTPSEPKFATTTWTMKEYGVLPTGLQFTAASGVGTLSVGSTVSASAVGSYPIMISAADVNGFSVTDSLTLTVTAARSQLKTTVKITVRLTKVQRIATQS